MSVTTLRSFFGRRLRHSSSTLISMRCEFLVSLIGLPLTVCWTSTSTNPSARLPGRPMGSISNCSRARFRQLSGLRAKASYSIRAVRTPSPAAKWKLRLKAFHRALTYPELNLGISATLPMISGRLTAFVHEYATPRLSRTRWRTRRSMHWLARRRNTGAGSFDESMTTRLPATRATAPYSSSRNARYARPSREGSRWATSTGMCRKRATRPCMRTIASASIALHDPKAAFPTLVQKSQSWKGFPHPHSSFPMTPRSTT